MALVFILTWVSNFCLPMVYFCVIMCIESFFKHRNIYYCWRHFWTGGTENLWKLLKSSGIPVEVCLSSNLIGGNVPSLKEHHINHFDISHVSTSLLVDIHHGIHTGRWHPCVKSKFFEKQTSESCSRTLESTFSHLLQQNWNWQK